MIYLVSTQKELFKSKRYSKISIEESLDIMKNWKLVQLDTETEGLDVFTKRLLTLQLGIKDIQIVIDCTTINIQNYKEFLESNRTFLGWNLLFDLKFLYHQGIYPNHVYDGMLAEKLIWLGYPAGVKGMSLKDTAYRYLNIDIDKTIRGKINQTGLTEDVIVYAAGDVKYLEDIKTEQDKIIGEQDLYKAVQFENEFVKCLAYIEYCGVLLDIPRWKRKMQNDLDTLNNAKKALDDWVVNLYKTSYNDVKKIITVDYCIEYTFNGEIIKLNPKIPTTARFIKYSTSRDPYGEYTYAHYYLDLPKSFCEVNTQGDLFSGFDTEPKCIINWSSSKQVIPLFEMLGFDLITFDKATKKKKKSVDAKIIKSQLHISPIASLYLEYQKASKVVSTYGQNWLDAINPVTGRIHANFYQLGADTARLSCGGGLANVNVQNLPHDAETRACFIADKGNKWISADYQGQESRIIASVSNDKAMLDLFNNGCGDVHSLVAKMSYKDQIGDTPIEDIKSKFHELRQEAKGIEFSINYGGDANTIMNNKGIPLKEAKVIYDNFMKGFPGIHKYQEYCRKDVMQKGYILLNPVTKHRAHIYDFDELDAVQKKFEDPEFWDYYREMKKEAPDCDTVKSVRNYFRRKSASEKQAINYRIQNRGAMCFKLASIKLFNYLKRNQLLNIVKYCIPVHDEINLECPEELSDEISKILVQCMVEGGKPFCSRVYLGADVEIGKHWIH